MFDRFTDRARRVLVLAQEEARMLNHNHIGTEHILLGLIHEGQGVTATALQSVGNLSLEDRWIEDIRAHAGDPEPIDESQRQDPALRGLLNGPTRHLIRRMKSSGNGGAGPAWAGPGRVGRVSLLLSVSFARMARWRA